MMRHLLLVMLAAVGVISCKRQLPAPGTACEKERDWECLSATSRAVCDRGVWRLDHCVSCTQTESSGLFSSSGRKTAEKCLRAGKGPDGSPCDDESFDCDGINEVKCVDGVYRHFPCRGKKGCRHDPDGLLACDFEDALIGDACDSEVAMCSVDRKAVVGCVDGKIAVVQVCMGPKGCVDGDGEYDCDLSVGRVGATCRGQGAACSEDGSAMVRCDGQTYVVARECRGAPGCEISNKSVSCAHPELAELGDPCQAGNNACSVDGTRLLVCENGHFATMRVCKKGCSFDGTKLKCP